MISFDEAFRITMSRARKLETERVGLESVSGAILAEDVRSDLDLPPFPRSLRDGYACRRADLSNELSVLETIQAGQIPTKSIGENECSKIMTGAVVPEGADTVVMVEFTETPTERTMKFVGKDTDRNIADRGEDVKAGELVLRVGERVLPQHIAVLATVGCVQPLVSRRPKVAIIETGDELVLPKEKPNPSQIRTTNGLQLCAQVTRIGAVPAYYGIARDTEEDIDRHLRQALEENDVVLVSGGVSMGDLDLVPDAMKKNGLDILFDRVAVKPGKPTTFAVRDDKYCFGLPGNPVSTFVQFELLVKPFLYLLQGHDFQPPCIKLPLAESYSQKRSERDCWIPVTVNENGEIQTCSYHGSGHIHALRGSEGMICIPAGVDFAEKGTKMEIRMID